jgi:ribosomal protein S12 methylthiotransferase accessory factor
MGPLGITRVAEVTGLDNVGIPVFQAIRPNARSLSVSQGKGSSDAAATASALGESIELWHAEHLDLPLRLASFREMQASRRVVDVAALPMTTPRRFHPDLQMLWCEGIDVLSGEPTWVPHDLVHLDNTGHRLKGHGAFRGSSNGLASGNHRLEAMSHALCEVIERDACAAWNAQGDEGRRRTRLDPDTVDDDSCRALLDTFTRAGVAVAIWDATGSAGLTTFFVGIIDRADSLVRPLSAFAGQGCHPDRGVALSRALSEAAQSRLTFVAGSRDDFTILDYDHIRSRELIEAHRQRIIDGKPARSFDDTVSFDHDTIDEDVEIELEALRGIGVEHVVALDLTREGLDIPVVKVVVPKLASSGHDMGWRPASGRLSQVLGS